MSNGFRLNGYIYIYNLTYYLLMYIIHNLYVIIIIGNVDLNLNNIYHTYFDISDQQVVTNLQADNISWFN